MPNLLDLEIHAHTGEHDYAVGRSVVVRQSARSPLAGQPGKIHEVHPSDPCGPYLVRFENGMAFRYTEKELTVFE